MDSSRAVEADGTPRRNRSDAALALAAADATIAARHARGLERLLDELGHRGAAVAAANLAERLDRALQMLARV